MGRPTSEEAKRKHVNELQAIRRRRYVELHGMKQFKVELTGERYNQIDNALKKHGVTKKQFIEDAIDRFLKETK